MLVTHFSRGALNEKQALNVINHALSRDKNNISISKSVIKVINFSNVFYLFGSFIIFVTMVSYSRSN